MQTLSTARLRLRPLRADDAEALHPAYADADLLQHWHQAPRRDVEDTAALLAAEVDRGTMWAICQAGTDEAMGHVGFHAQGPALLGQVAFGYLLRRDAWGQGFASEAASAVVEHGFRDLDVGACELWIYDGNERSRRVAERLGADLRGTFWGFNLDKREARRIHVYAIEGPRPLPPEVVRVAPVLSVPDVAAAVCWWCDELGFHLEWMVGDPPVSASVVSPGFLPQAASVRLNVGPPSPVRLAFAVPRRFDELAAAVGAVPVDRPWGMREVERTDPWGTTVVFETPG